MNILNIVDSRKWDITAYQALHMAIQFRKSGHNAALMCPMDCKLHYEAVEHDIPVKQISFLFKYGSLKDQLCDVAHFYNPDSVNALILKKVAAVSRVFISQIRLTGPKTLLRLKGFEPYVSRFIASCPSVQEDLSGAGIDPARIFIVPPAINIGRWESAMLIKPAMFLKRPYKVGTISMDKTLKEQEFFLKTAKEVLKALPDTHFMIVGLKDDRIRIMAQALGISHKLDILWERKDIPEIMAMLHIFVKAADHACLSMALIEAQASGVACVVPRVRGLSDHIIHECNGLLVEPGNTGSFARVITYLILNPSVCHIMSRMAYDQANYNMSVPVAANMLSCLYDDAMAAK